MGKGEPGTRYTTAEKAMVRALMEQYPEVTSVNEKAKLVGACLSPPRSQDSVRNCYFRLIGKTRSRAGRGQSQ